LENIEKIGTVDEIYGPLDGFRYTINCDTGIKASSFNVGDKFYMGRDDCLQISRFTGP